MSSRRNNPSAIERRTKRLLGRHNFDLLTPERLTPKIREHGGYKVRDAATGDIIFGQLPYEFSATLEEIEAWLETLEA